MKNLIILALALLSLVSCQKQNGDIRTRIELIDSLVIDGRTGEADSLLNKIKPGSLTDDDLRTGLRNGVLRGDLTPVLVCSALENKGGAAILDTVQALLPSPLERPPFVDAEGNERASSPDEPLAAFVFKTLADPFTGQLSFLRILSGTIDGDATVKNTRSEENERLGNLLYMVGKNQTPCKDVVGPGAIVAVAKL